MSNQTLHIDDLLNASYTGFEPAVPAFAWDQIAGKLDQQNKRRGFIWWKVAAIVAVISGIASLVYYNSNIQNPSESANPAQNEAKASEPTGAADNATQNGPLSDKADKDQNSQNSGSSAVRDRHISNPGIFSAPELKAAPESPATPEVEASKDVRSIESMNRTAGLKSFGIRYQDLELNPVIAPAKNRLSNEFPEPMLSVSNKWLIGLGAGQVLSATGYTVNPQYGNYVHKNFTKRMEQGEGLLSSLNFSGMVAYKVAGNHFIYSGAEFYQRRNSLNFNFKDEAPALNSVGNVKKDIFGNYPIKGYITSGSGVEVNYTGTNTITAVEIPLGWMMQLPMGKKFTFIPSAGAGLGFISLNAMNSTLNYQLLEVEKVNQSWYRKTYTILNASAGVYKNLGNRLKWGVNANAGYTLSQMYVPNSPVRPRAFTGGLTTRLIWRLD